MIRKLIYKMGVLNEKRCNILGDCWNDFVCVWKRVNVEDKETNITVHSEIITSVGILEKTINDNGLQTRKKC
jgi:hypothetical protein